jgi:hypothetical protein
MSSRLTAGVAALAAVVAAGCESTQERSARLARAGRGDAAQQTVRLGAQNRSVRVMQTALLRSSDVAAAVVRLHNGGRSQAGVPILLDARDASGHVVYRNDVAGLDPALQGIALLKAGQDAFWVNDQVTATPTPRSLEVRVGRAQRPVSGTPPRIAVDRVGVQRDGGQTVVSGRIANGSATVQRNLALFCVALRGDRIVAAGRAILPRLDAKPVSFHIYLVGDATGARLVFTAPPTVLPKGAA